MSRHADGAAGRQGDVPGAGSGRRHRHRRATSAADGVAAVEVEYEPLPVVVDPKKALEPGAPRAAPRSRRTRRQPHLALGVGRQGRPRTRAFEDAEVTVKRRHLHPADPRRLDRDLRLRRRLRPGPPAADRLHDDARRRTPSGPCSRWWRPRRPAGAEDPGHLARHRRRLRRQGAGLPGLRDRGGGLGADRQAGQVDRGPIGEPAGRLVRPRLPHHRRAAAQEGRAR